MLRVEHDAEEVGKKAYLRAFNRLDEFRGESSLAPGSPASASRSAARACQRHSSAVACLLAGTNPDENVWEYLRGNKLSARVWPDYPSIVDTCCEVWNEFLRDTARIVSVTSRDWASVKR